MLYPYNAKIHGHNDTQGRSTPAHLAVALVCMVAMSMVSLSPREAKAEVISSTLLLLSSIVSLSDSGSNVTALTVQQNRRMLQRNLELLEKLNNRLDIYDKAMEKLFDKIDDLPGLISREFGRSWQERDIRRMHSILAAHRDHRGTESLLAARIQVYQELCGTLMSLMDSQVQPPDVAMFGDRVIALMTCAVGELVFLLPEELFRASSRTRSEGKIKEMKKEIHQRALRYVRAFYALLPKADKIEEAHYRYASSILDDRKKRVDSLEKILSQLTDRRSHNSRSIDCPNDLDPCIYSGISQLPDYKAIALLNEGTQILVEDVHLMIEGIKQLPCDEDSWNESECKPKVALLDGRRRGQGRWKSTYDGEAWSLRIKKLIEERYTERYIRLHTYRELHGQLANAIPKLKELTNTLMRNYGIDPLIEMSFLENLETNPSFSPLPNRLSSKRYVDLVKEIEELAVQDWTSRKCSSYIVCTPR